MSALKSGRLKTVKKSKASLSRVKTVKKPKASLSRVKTVKKSKPLVARYKATPVTASAKELVLNDSMQMYLKEISQFPILSKHEEAKLSKEFYETKDPRIARVLAQANLRFVVKVAAEYTRFGARLIDLVQEGNIGLLHAIKAFNPYKGVCLITYAVWWIKGYIQEYLMRQYSLVRMGSNAKQRKLFYLLRKEQEKLQQIPYTGEMKLLAPPGFKESEVKDMRKRITGRDVSLDQKNPADERLVDSQTYEEEPLEERLSFFQEKNLLRKNIEELRPQLSQKERFVLDHRLLSETPLTLQEIGDRFFITREAIRQIENRLIQKIKARLTHLKPT